MIWIALASVVMLGAGAWFGARTWPTRAVVLVAGVAALGAYWLIGRPGMADAPLAGRLADLEQMAVEAPDELTAAQALALLRERARLAPNDPRPHMGMGELYAATDRPDEAMTAYRAALRRDPAFTPAQDAISDLQFRASGEIDAATRARAAEIRERARSAPETLTSVQFLLLLEERAEAAPDDPTPHRLMGDIFQSTGHLERAETAYRAALERDAEDVEALKELADMQFTTSGAVDAETADLYSRAWRLDPADLRIGYLAGVGDWQAGRRDEAEALWADIEARTPEGDPRLEMFKALRETFAVESAAPD